MNKGASKSYTQLWLWSMAWQQVNGAVWGDKNTLLQHVFRYQRSLSRKSESFVTQHALKKRLWKEIWSF